MALWHYLPQSSAQSGPSAGLLLLTLLQVLPWVFISAVPPSPLKADDSAAGTVRQIDGEGAHQCADWYENATRRGTTFRSTRDFGAVGDGVTDDTAALQAAINHARGETEAKANAVVYLPSGEYLISDTLIMWFSTALVGNSGCPPTIRLKDHMWSAPCAAAAAAGAAAGLACTPMVATTNGFGQKMTGREGRCYNSTHEKPCSAVYLDPNCHFYSAIRHVHFDLGVGNAGASAVHWRVAQQTALRNIVIEARDAGVGLDVNAGGGTIEDVIVRGGQYGTEIVPFLRHFMLNTIFLPSQARDKHRESREKKAFAAGITVADSQYLFKNVTVSGSAIAGAETPVVRRLIQTTEQLPRQARDKHRKRFVKRHMSNDNLKA